MGILIFRCWWQAIGPIVIMCMHLLQMHDITRHVVYVCTGLTRGKIGAVLGL